MISPLVLKTLKNRNEKTTEEKLERNVKNMTTYALVDTKDTNNVKKWEILDKVEINKIDLMDCIKIQKWYEDSCPNINPLALYLKMCHLQEEDYDFPYVGESEEDSPLIITIIENGEIFQP